MVLYLQQSYSISLGSPLVRGPGLALLRAFGSIPDLFVFYASLPVNKATKCLFSPMVSRSACGYWLNEIHCWGRC